MSRAGQPGPARRLEPAARQPDPDGRMTGPAARRWPLPAVDQQTRPSRILRPSRPGDEIWAMLGYLLVPFFSFLPAVAIYLLKMRGSAFVRAHATQALNLGITLFLYGICATIVGGLLALDSVAAAVTVAGGAIALLWLAALAYSIRAGTAASNGGYSRIPGWLCATVVRS